MEPWADVLTAKRDLGARSPEYSAWQGMRSRCFNPAATGFVHYGARGITVCERWRNSFENFLADMGRRPSARHSLDRIDNDGDYEPGNVRWATQAEQTANKGHRRRTEIVIAPLGKSR
jgi:hypothetical protein